MNMSCTYAKSIALATVLKHTCKTLDSKEGVSPFENNGIGDTWEEYWMIQDWG